MIDIIRQIDINVFASFLMIIVVIAQHIRRKKRAYSNIFFRYLCLSTFLLLILDLMPWVFDGIPNKSLRNLVYISNFILLLFEPLPLIFWLWYLDYQIYKSFDHLKKRLFYMQPMIFIIIIMIISIPTGLIFYIDSSNWYNRGPGFFIIPSINYIITFYSIFLTWINRNYAEKKVLQIAVLFGLIPLFGALLQIKFYGLNLIWPCVSLSVLLAYIYLEIQMEIRDYLTGLLNRQQIDELISLRIVDFIKKGSFTVLMIDLDNFKEVNDEYGHNEGDNVLIRISNILLSSVKAVDKVARFGGDEFTILLETDKFELVESIINRLSINLEKDLSGNPVPYKISFSAGYTIYNPELHKGYKDLLHSADEQMYIIKNLRKK